MEKNPGYRKRLSVLAWKLVKSLGISSFILVCAILAIYLAGGKGQQAIVTIAGFLVFAELAVIWKPASSKLKVNCPQCGRWVKGAAQEMIRDKGVCPKCKLKVNCPQCGRLLKGATGEMIGDTGVCPKCKAEFVIEQNQ